MSSPYRDRDMRIEWPENGKDDYVLYYVYMS